MRKRSGLTEMRIITLGIATLVLVERHGGHGEVD